MQKQTSSAALSYKCPNCGAPISFNPEFDLFTCEFCLSRFTPIEMEEYDLKRRQEAEQRVQHAASKEAKAQADDRLVHTYNCNSCGAQVVTTETTTATFCYYCHNPVIIDARMYGDDRPDEIIPFDISEEEAIEKFLEWTEHKKFIPDDFRSPEHIEKMTGIYVPYWFVDSDVEVNFVGKSTRSQSHRTSTHIVQQDSDYEHVRQGTYLITDANIAANSKIDIDLLNGIEPYDTNKIQTFSMPLLSGYFAESYTLTEDEGAKILENYVYHYADNLLNRSFQHTGSVSTLHKDFQQVSQGTRYVLLPVWILTYNYNGEIYVFAVNGETGKMAGELPIVEEKLRNAALKNALTAFLVAFVIVMLILLFFWWLS